MIVFWSIAPFFISSARRQPRMRTGIDIRGNQIDEVTQAILYVPQNRSACCEGGARLLEFS